MSKNSTRCSTRFFAIAGLCLTLVAGCGTTDTGGGGGGGGGGQDGGTGGGKDGGGTVGCSPTCDRGFVCQGSTCVLDPTGRWVIRVTTGTVAMRKSSGDTWDVFGGAPDPKVCLTLSGSRTCTPVVDDSFAPTWNTDFPAVTATALQVGIPVEYIDYDGASSDDPICTGNVPVTTTSFSQGSWTLSCSGALGQVNARLTPQ